MHLLKGTSQLPGIGRIVHVYGPGHYGARPGIVVNSAADVEFKSTTEVDRGEGRTELVTESLGFYRAMNVNMFADGRADEEVLEAFRRSAAGNTICDCPVFDTLSDGDREWLRLNAPNGWWAEWPPRD